MAKAKTDDEEFLFVNTERTVSPEPPHSQFYGQSEEDLKADEFPTGDPVLQEALGVKPD